MSQDTPRNMKIRHLRAIVRDLFLRVCCLFPGRVRVTISYDALNAQHSFRTIRPLRMVRKQGWCACGKRTYGPLKLDAWCETKGALRHFFSHQMRIYRVRWL